MTLPRASAVWMQIVRPMALGAVPSVALIGLAVILILVLLPAALGAAGHQVPRAG